MILTVFGTKEIICWNNIANIVRSTQSYSGVNIVRSTQSYRVINIVRGAHCTVWSIKYHDVSSFGIPLHSYSKSKFEFTGLNQILEFIFRCVLIKNWKMYWPEQSLTGFGPEDQCSLWGLKHLIIVYIYIHLMHPFITGNNFIYFIFIWPIVIKHDILACNFASNNN